jgi:hypothetical protein
MLSVRERRSPDTPPRSWLSISRSCHSGGRGGLLLRCRRVRWLLAGQPWPIRSLLPRFGWRVPRPGCLPGAESLRAAGESLGPCPTARDFLEMQRAPPRGCTSLRNPHGTPPGRALDELEQAEDQDHGDSDHQGSDNQHRHGHGAIIAPNGAPLRPPSLPVCARRLVPR